MPIDVTVPPVGESITEGVLAEWLKHDGDVVTLDDPLFSLETDKITMTVNATSAGRLGIKVAAGETVKIGQVVGSIDPSKRQTRRVPELSRSNRGGTAFRMLQLRTRWRSA